MKSKLVIMDDDPSVLKKMEQIEEKLNDLMEQLLKNKAVLGQGYPEVLTLELAAQMLTLSDRHLTTLRDEEGLPSHPLGSRVVIIKQELLDWLAQRKIKQ